MFVLRFFMKLKGFILAAFAAAFYGTNPAFAVPLYDAGMNAATVLLFRYILGMPILAAVLMWRGEALVLKRNELVPVAILGIMMGLSSLMLYEAYNYMNAGIASTLLFMYPVLTAILMSAFFHEKFRAVTGLCLLVMGAGLYLLMRAPDGTTISLKGFILIFVSSLTYAIYLVMFRASRAVQRAHVTNSLLYQLFFGSFVFIFMLAFFDPLTMPHKLSEWANLGALAFMPTVLSLFCTIRAIKYIGPTPTAIFGALEPVTAVVLSVLILGETLTLREVEGSILIILATMLVVVSDQVDARLKFIFKKIAGK